MGMTIAVGPAHAALRDAGARYRRGLEARALDEPHAVAVVDAGLDQDFRLVDELLEPPSFAAHDSFSLRPPSGGEL